MSTVMLGIHLAKNVFALHGMNEAGRDELKRSALGPCTEAMESC